MRDYQLMKTILNVVNAQAPCGYVEVSKLGKQKELDRELERLQDEGLIKSSFKFSDGVFLGGSIEGITEEGKDFLRLIENQDVWALVLQTLRKADIDISYPLLKEVCEEIVKRYVTSCIPKI